MCVYVLQWMCVYVLQCIYIVYVSVFVLLFAQYTCDNMTMAPHQINYSKHICVDSQSEWLREKKLAYKAYNMFSCLTCQLYVNLVVQYLNNYSLLIQKRICLDRLYLQNYRYRNTYKICFLTLFTENLMSFSMSSYNQWYLLLIIIITFIIFPK